MKQLMLIAAAMLAGCCAVNTVPTPMNEALQPFVDKEELSGAISILYKDGIEEISCVGWADKENARPITLDSTFMQCSQTKGFCGVTIAKLVEEGKLKLDDPVAKYLPEFKELWVEKKNADGTRTLVKAKNVLTVRMCLNHTGGLPFDLPNYGVMGGWSRKMPLRSVAATAAAQPIQFEPGTKTAYSNTGIDIGAAVVEVVTGKRWEEYVQETVLDPLGMSDSTFWPTEEMLSRRIFVYGLDKNATKTEKKPVQNSMQPPYGDDRVFASAGAGLWTTARDQLKFYKMLMNLGLGENGVRILKEETVKSILAVSTRPVEVAKGDGYSLGLRAPIKDGEDQWFGHGGAWGTNCFVNWHKRQLKLWVVQQVGGKNTWDKSRFARVDRFFSEKAGSNTADAYTGRMK